MKHIFKKLHLTSHNDLNRTNEIPLPSSSSSSSSSPSPSTVSDHRIPATSGYSPPSPSSTAGPTTTTGGGTGGGGGGLMSDQSDYISSEEEYQVQLALAISASNSAFQEDQDKRNRNDSRREAEDAAESLSRRYWDYNVLDYDEKVVDGFYDIYGVSVDAANQGKMPSLSDLQANNGDTGFEIILVNRAIDPALEELNQVVHCIGLDCDASEVSLLVQRLADLVTEHMGGPVRDATIMLSRWIDKATQLRTSLQTNILPIGSLNIGLSRHRALLFKVLADNVGIACRLVKGSHYTGIDDDAVNIIKLENEREFLVDLMAAPGTLIPADILNINDTSLSSFNPILSKIPSFQIANDLGDNLLNRDAENKAHNGKSIAENNIPMLWNSSSEKMEVMPSFSSGSNGELPMSINSSSNGNSKFAVPPNDSYPLSSSVIETSQFKGKQGGVVIRDRVKENVNVVPYSQDTVEDKKIPFAELNPFNLIGSSKSFMQNKLPDNKVNGFQRTDNITSGPGRPPLPMKWKNRPTHNEVPRKKQYESGDGLFARNNQESNHYNAPSPSFAASDKIHPEVPNANNVSFSYLVSTDIGNKESYGGSDSKQYNKLASDVGTSLKPRADILFQSPVEEHQGNYFREGENSAKDIACENKEHEKIIMGKHDRRKHTDDRFIGTNLMSRHLESSSSRRLDPMLDVAEWEIPWEDLVIGERIGLGSYGEVYHADWKGTEVAVKKFLDQDFSGDALDEFRSEVRIMRRLRHPNVVLFLGAVTRPPNLSIISEFLPRGSLYRIIHRPNCQIDEKQRIQMALDVAKGMECLHTSIPTIVHRDLKSPNLLVDNNWNVKVCDFGLSRLKHNTFLSSKSTAGTPEWMAPEVLRNEQSNEKCDVYSFGVILWELATLRMPWTGMNQMQVVGAVGFQNRRLDIPKEVDPLVAQIIRDCWQTESNLRPSFAQLATALNSLQRLVVPSYLEQQSSDPPLRT